MKQSGNDAEQNEMLIRANDKYTLFEWTILLGSIISNIFVICNSIPRIYIHHQKLLHSRNHTRN